MEMTGAKEAAVARRIHPAAAAHAVRRREVSDCRGWAAGSDFDREARNSRAKEGDGSNETGGIQKWHG